MVVTSLNASCNSITPSSCITTGQGCTSPTNFPEFIDTGACLCGLLSSIVIDPNGGLIELWRCIGDANQNVVSGATGKWFDTQLPSQDLSGYSQAQNWSPNPPDTHKVYTVEDIQGRPKYVAYNGTSVQVSGKDLCCTGINSTAYSTDFYNGPNKPKPFLGSAVPRKSAVSGLFLAGLILTPVLSFWL